MSPTVFVHTRWDDGDRFGHVNNAAYLALIRDATDRVLGGALTLATIEIEFRRPVPTNADIDVSVRPGEGTPESSLVEYELSFEAHVCARATARWRSSANTAPELPGLQKDVGGAEFSWEHAVRSYEIGPGGALRPPAALQWFEYAVYRAAERVGWSAERMLAAGFVTLQIGHRLALGPTPRVGERLAIVSRLVEMRRVSGTWHHEARRDRRRARRGGPLAWRIPRRRG
ncbi:MAG TPA: thioesterase family protein, partial [Candidatus Limnocylindria bacterium]|nr:thioesterase family protein [Candidatus Limnocylindria bacterium]